MLDLLKKVMYTGMGFAALTEQKAEELVSELEKRGEVSAEEGKKLAEELLDKAKQQKEEFQSTITEEVNKVAKRLGFVSRKDYEALERRLAELEARCCPSEGDDTL